MGLGVEDKKVTYVNIKIKRKVEKGTIIDPYLMVKDNRTDPPTITEFKYIEGRLMDIFRKENKVDNKMLVDCNFVFLDQATNELFILQTSQTSIWRNIISSLANIDSFGQIKIKVKQGKSRNPKTLGQNIAIVFVNNDNQNVDWKFNYDNDFRPLITVIKKGDGSTENDPYKLNLFLWDVINTHILPKVKRDAPKETSIVSTPSIPEDVDFNDPDGSLEEPTTGTPLVEKGTTSIPADEFYPDSNKPDIEDLDFENIGNDDTFEEL